MFSKNHVNNILKIKEAIFAMIKFVGEKGDEETIAKNDAVCKYASTTLNRLQKVKTFTEEEMDDVIEKIKTAILHKDVTSLKSINAQLNAVIATEHYMAYMIKQDGNNVFDEKTTKQLSSNIEQKKQVDAPSHGEKAMKIASSMLSIGQEKHENPNVNTSAQSESSESNNLHPFPSVQI